MIFPASSGTWKFIIVLKTACHLSLCKINPAHVLPSYLFNIHFNIILPSKSWSFKGSPSFRFSHPNPVCITSSPCMSHVLPITSSLIWSPYNFVRSTDHEAAHYAIFFILLSTSPFYAKIRSFFLQHKSTTTKINTDDSIVVGCDIVSLGKWFLTFWRNMSLSSSRIQSPQNVFMDLEHCIESQKNEILNYTAVKT